MDSITYKDNTASAEQILTHFKSCDADFYESLSARINIEGYAGKLVAKSFRHEAWQGDELVGLVAVYYNRNPEGFDFITDVSVNENNTGQKIASNLLSSCIEKAKSGGSAELRLEVTPDNIAALNLYKKFGFLQFETTNTGIILSLALKTG